MDAQFATNGKIFNKKSALQILYIQTGDTTSKTIIKNTKL